MGNGDLIARLAMMTPQRNMAGTSVCYVGAVHHACQLRSSVVLSTAIRVQQDPSLLSSTPPPAFHALQAKHLHDSAPPASAHANRAEQAHMQRRVHPRVVRALEVRTPRWQTAPPSHHVVTVDGGKVQPMALTTVTSIE